MPIGLLTVTGSRWKSSGGATCLWAGESGRAQSGMTGACVCADADAASNRRTLANLAGRIFHHHICNLGRQHICRQMRGEADTDIKGPAGLEEYRRAFRMQRLALPADVKLESVTLLLDANAGGMESLRPFLVGAEARLARGAIFDIGHLAALLGTPGDMDHAVAVLGGHDLAAVIVQAVADQQRHLAVMEVVDIGPVHTGRQRNIAAHLLPQIM